MTQSKKSKKAPLQKRSVGAPTKYRAKFCGMLIEHMSQGFSFESFAGRLGVVKQTLYNWEVKPEFLDAKQVGIEKCRLWWETLGIQGVQGLGPEVVYQRKEVTVKAKEELEEGKQIEFFVPADEVTYRAAQFNSGTWFRNMTNRFPQEWRDRQEITGKDGGPMEINFGEDHRLLEAPAALSSMSQPKIVKATLLAALDGRKRSVPRL